MHPEEAKKYIEDHADVKKIDIVVAKAYIVKHFIEETATLVNSFLKYVDAEMPERILLDTSEQEPKTIQKAVQSFSQRLAALEAIWGLIHSNILFPKGDSLSEDHLHVGCTRRLGGNTGFSLEGLIPVPRYLRRSYFEFRRSEQYLSDADLYVHELNISNLSQGIEEALKEAVKCFRYELYTACLAMLGKVSEGAWFELGMSLNQALNGTNPSRFENIKNIIEDPRSSIPDVIKKVKELYNQKECEKVREQSDVSPNELSSIGIWSDNVRDSRNTVHYGFNAAMRNSYEKVASLLTGAVPVIKVIYRIKNIADKI